MRRREYLASVGSLGLLGVGAPPSRSTGDTLTVRVWFTEAAASYDGLRSRITEFVRTAFGPLFDRVALSWGGPVSASTEDAYEAMTSLEWPLKLLRGRVGLGECVPVDDVNLLVTDGDVTAQYTGMGIRSVAAVSGARHIAAMSPRAATPDEVPYSLPAFRTQVLLHEVGHTLGLSHEHGRLDAHDDYAVASPMVSTYPWADADVREGQFSFERRACGASFPDVSEKDCVLSFEFSACATAALGTSE